MKIIEVNNKRTERLFITMPLPLYASDPNYIRPLDNDIEDVFNPEKNPLFKNGECARWVLQDSNFRTIGRIAAFYDSKTSAKEKQPTGGCGFFECTDDQNAANLLFNTAKNWLEKRGMEAMDGPINFGSREKWWGLLVDGFHEPCYCCNYNPPYYQTLFENYGFQEYFKQFTYRRVINEAVADSLVNKAQPVLKNPDYTFAHIKRNERDKAALDFMKVYNGAWGNHIGVRMMTASGARKIMRSLNPILDERIIWFAYHRGEPVGFFVNIPDVNQLIVKHVSGTLNWWGKLKFLWNKLQGNCETMFGIVFGIVSDHQKKGVEAALIIESANFLQHNKRVKYRDLQMNWIGDFNPRMINVVKQLDADIYKTHHTYRYLFDRNKPFERHPRI